MPRTNSSPSAGSTVVDKLKSYEGGTGQTTASAALAALGGVPASSINQANGVAGLDANQKLSAAVLPADNISVVSAQGPTTLVKGFVGYYTITNYDAFANYSLTAISGTVSRAGALITYTAPSSPGAGGFTLAGRAFNVTVTDFAPVTPTLAATDTGNGAGTAMIRAQGNAFSMQGNSDTHLNTDWQVASDANFSSIVLQSLADASNKTAWNATPVNLSTTYYVRCRYRSSGNFVSQWSNTVTVTTKAAYNINTEISAFSSPSPVAQEQFGVGCSLSGDGNRLAVGSMDGNNNIGAVYVYVRNGSTWSLEQKISSPYSPASNWFGFSTALDDTGTRMMVGVPYGKVNSGGYNTGGNVLVYLRTGSTWALEATLQVTNFGGLETFNQALGWCVACDSDATRIIAGSPLAYIDSSNSVGGFYIFKRTGTSWAVEKQKFSDTAQANSQFGNAVTISPDGSRVAVGCPRYGTDHGSVCIYVRSGTSWAQEGSTIIGSTANTAIGTSVRIDSTGTRLIIGGPYYPTGSAGGVAYIYLRTGSAWALEATLTYNPSGTGALFGKRVHINAAGNKAYIVSENVVNARVSGTISVYTRSGTTWSFSYKFTPASPAGNDIISNFGGIANSNGTDAFSVNKDENTLAIGSYASTAGNNTIANCGKVNVFVAT